MDPIDEREERIARRAYAIWEREGRPEGRDREHWDLAAEEIAIEDNLGATLTPVQESIDSQPSPGGEPVEPVEENVENQADMPGLSDQDRNIGIPRRRGRREGA